LLDWLPLLAIDIALLTFAWRRPWHGLVVLMAGLPLNAIATQILPVALELSTPARVLAGAWHDALAGGFLLAAVEAAIRARTRQALAPPSRLIWIVGAMVALGALFVVVSPVRLTALYSFRVLYEPPLLLGGIIVLAPLRPAPGWLVSRMAAGFVVATAAGAVFTWLQVYVLRYRFLQTYYTDPGEQIHHSYLATGINQPRGIGFVNSPNEFGAVIAIAIVLLLAPGILHLSRRWRAWILVALGLALALSFSRSGMLATGIGVVVVAALARDAVREHAASVRSRRALLELGPPAFVGALLLVAIIATSGAPKLVVQTVSGAEPSAAGRVDSAKAGIVVLRENPLGLGLGTAGPKAARFGETEGRPRILTEVWYVLYAIQVGVVGLLILAAAAADLFIRLWRSRDGPLSRAVLAMGIGLGAGAVFIPIIDEPTVWTPLWALAGLAVAAGVPVIDRERQARSVSSVHAAPTAG
jgi:hypothetical protein